MIHCTSFFAVESMETTQLDAKRMSLPCVYYFLTE